MPYRCALFITYSQKYFCFDPLKSYNKSFNVLPGLRIASMSICHVISSKICHITFCNQIWKFVVQPCKIRRRRVYIISHLTAPAARGLIQITYIPYADNSSLQKNSQLNCQSIRIISAIERQYLIYINLYQYWVLMHLNVKRNILSNVCGRFDMIYLIKTLQDLKLPARDILSSDKAEHF